MTKLLKLSCALAILVRGRSEFTYKVLGNAQCMLFNLESVDDPRFLYRPIIMTALCYAVGMRGNGLRFPLVKGAR